MSGILSNQNSKSQESERKPSESEYNIALLAHTIKNFDRIVWQVYDHPEIKTQLQNFIESNPQMKVLPDEILKIQLKMSLKKQKLSLDVDLAQWAN